MTHIDARGSGQPAVTCAHAPLWNAFTVHFGAVT